MYLYSDSGFLTDELIDSWGNKVQELYVGAFKKNDHPTMKARLGIDDILIRFREIYGTDTMCFLECYKSSNILRIVISQQGDHINPLVIEENDISINILERLDLTPKYTYKTIRRLNIVTVPLILPPRKNSLLKKLGLAVVLAVLTKIILGVLPGNVGTEYVIPFITELFSKMTAIFSAVATPLVFFAVINGISGLGSFASFGKVGNRLLRRMLFTYVMAMVFMVTGGLIFGLASFGLNAAGNNVFAELLHLVLDMVPSNIVEPFITDNDLQVIVLSIFIGIVMLGLGEKIDTVRNLSVQLGDLINRMMLTVCKLMPLFVYLGVSDLILSDRLNNIYKVSQIIILTLACDALVIAVTIIRTLVVTKIPIKKMFSSQLPSLIINLTTSSQVSAYPESVKCCRDRFGIDQKVTDFGLPLGIVVYMPNGAIMLGAMAWVLTVMNVGPLDMGTVIKIAFVAMVVAIAAPPIPGSAFAVMPILFSACGTDLAMMPLAVIVASTVGYLLPAMNGFCLQEELLMSAYKSGMVDEKTMRAPID